MHHPVLPLLLATLTLSAAVPSGKWAVESDAEIESIASPALTARAASNAGHRWKLSQFSDLITFGDSYTDENRLNYFFQNNGQPPPPGTLLPESLSTSSGGRTWARYVIQYTGRDRHGKWDPAMTLYDYAVSGAVCDNELSPRFLSGINQDFPAVRQYEVPAFLADRKAQRNGSSTKEPYFDPRLSASNSVYAMWDGTNDVGAGAFFDAAQRPGHVLTDYSDCIFAQFDRLYAAGGRYFVLMNLVPLDLTPLYANASAGGVTSAPFWPHKPSNLTQIADQMKQYVTLLNSLWRYRLPFETLIARRYPGVHFALYDVHSLVMDIYTDPTNYLNGSAPANITGYQKHCDDSGNCKYQGSPDSYLWYDQLHPSEQADRIIAKEFVEVLKGKGKYATYFDG